MERLRHIGGYRFELYLNSISSYSTNNGIKQAFLFLKLKTIEKFDPEIADLVRRELRELRDNLSARIELIGGMSPYIEKMISDKIEINRTRTHFETKIYLRFTDAWYRKFRISKGGRWSPNIVINIVPTKKIWQRKPRFFVAISLYRVTGDHDVKVFAKEFKLISAKLVVDSLVDDIVSYLEAILIE